MGVGKYTPNAAIHGDMGWVLPNQRQWFNVTKHWWRLMNMDADRLNKRIFLWTISMSGRRVKKLVS